MLKVGDRVILKKVGVCDPYLIGKIAVIEHMEGQTLGDLPLTVVKLNFKSRIQWAYCDPEFKPSKFNFDVIERIANGVEEMLKLI